MYVCMYVCMYARMYVCLFVCVYGSFLCINELSMCMYVYIMFNPYFLFGLYEGIRDCMCIDGYVYMYLCMYAYVCVCACM